MAEKIDRPKDGTERNARLDLVMSAIMANPEHWDQSMWHCKTSHCYAGFAQCIGRGLDYTQRVVFSRDEDGDIDCTGILVDDRHCDTSLDAERFCGLTSSQSQRLFDSMNEIEDLCRIIAEIKATPYWPPTEAAP